MAGTSGEEYRSAWSAPCRTCRRKWVVRIKGSEEESVEMHRVYGAILAQGDPEKKGRKDMEVYIYLV
jgi:hypothetical protein